jgi:type IV pilus assembly protein PilB
MAHNLRLGDLLVDAGLIDEFQLEAALGHQRRFGNRLGVALVRLGFLREEDLLATLGRQLGLPVVRLAGKRIAPEVLERVPASLMEKHGCLPLFVRREGDLEALYLGTADPTDRGALEDIARAARLPVRPVLVAPTDLHEAVSRCLEARAESADEDDDGSDPTIPAAEDTAPLVAPESQSVSHAPGVIGATPPRRPREVRTRVILHALTQLLIEQGVIDRKALLMRVEALDRAQEPDPEA